MTRRLTRRAALSLGAGAVAGLAGCNSVPGVGSDDEPTYDGAALASLARNPVPRADATFPLAVPDARLQSHRDRARERVAGVPADPSLPNEALADRIAEERRRVAGSVEERRDADGPPIERLGEWRHVRGDAAALAATWRAATGTFDRAALRSRRERLRSRRYDALDRWDYRAPSAAAALAVHEWVERRFAVAERELAPWPPVPDDPQSDVFVVGDAARNVDRAAATLGDVGAVLAPVRERGDTSRREAVVAAANALDRRERRGPDRVDVDDYLDERGRPSFGHDIEETPARRAFSRARQTLESAREDADERRRRGQYATAAMEAATAAVAAGAFRDVTDGIRRGEYGAPADAEAVRERWSTAVDALERALAHEPTALSVGLADTARGHLRAARWYLEEDDAGEEVDDAVGSLVYAARYAERVPEAVDDVAEALDD